jgi:hypothetical protein
MYVMIFTNLLNWFRVVAMLLSVNCHLCLRKISKYPFSLLFDVKGTHLINPRHYKLLLVLHFGNKTPNL